MTNLDDTAAGDIQAAIDAGLAAADPQPLDLGGFYAITTQRGTQLVDLTGDQYRDRPRRTIRQVTVDDVGSFVDYWDKHANLLSEVYADRRKLAIRAIIDAPGPNETDWGEHILTLQLRHSEPWNAWADKDRNYMWQAQFAEHIEDNLPDIASPPGAEMLEVAQTLHATTKVAFQSGYRLVNGQRQLQYVEETTGTAGPKGQLEIPAEFTLLLPVFHGSNAGDQVRARLRYRIESSQLKLGYALDRATEVVDSAFTAVVSEVEEGVGARPIFHGSTA